MESSGSSGSTSPDPTLLGILSDTHDRVDTAAAAIATLRAAGAQFLIHCGDVGGERILDLLAGMPCVFVWGNNDWDRAGLSQYAADIGLQCCNDFADLQISGKRIAVTHGDNLKLIQRVTQETDYDYLFLGHTHIPSNEKTGRLRIVNPGALHRAAKKTVAIVDLANDTVRHLIV